MHKLKELKVSIKDNIEQGLHKLEEKATQHGLYPQAKQYAIQGSNIENLGGDEERLAKLKAASSSNEFQNAGKEELGIWRIEDFVARRWPTSKHGVFYTGDSFLVLKRYGNPTNPDYHLHFWLGTQTTQDEAGAAAYKTVELDTLLGDRPVQHREVQGHESDLFLSHFPKGIRILDGGYESTKWHHVTPGGDDKPIKIHLLQVRGNGKHVAASEVPATANSLNSGDVFILDDENTNIIVWFGSSSSPFEKSKASAIAEQIESERASKARTITIDESHSGPEADRFWQLLGGKKAVRPASVNLRSAPIVSEKRILKLAGQSGASRQYDFVQVATGTQVTKSVLESSSVYLVDSGTNLFVWVGRNAGLTDKLNAFVAAEKYLKSQPDRGLIPITALSEGQRSEEFNHSF